MHAIEDVGSDDMMVYAIMLMESNAQSEMFATGRVTDTEGRTD